MLLNIIKAIILGIVQGITEWLPVSGSAHQIILNKIVSLNVPAGFFSLFMCAVQLGAVIALMVVFSNRLNPFSSLISPKKKKSIWQLWKKILVASIPVGFVGFFFGGAIGKLFHNSVWVISAALVIYGLLFFWVENRLKNNPSPNMNIARLSLGMAFILGFSQILALIPGTSRLAVVILCALIFGFSRSAAVEISVYMSVPVTICAAISELIGYIASHPNLDTSGNLIWSDIWAQVFTVIFGMVAAFIASTIFIRRLIAYISRHDLRIFGFYRIILGAVFILVSLISVIL